MLARSAIPCIALENPVSILSSLWRKPDQIIQPWQFGHGETKATCLWLKGLPPLVPTHVVEGRTARIHHMPPFPDRWKLRSRTYPGIAAAMAAQWGTLQPGHYRKDRLMSTARTRPVAQAVMARRFSGAGLDRYEYFPTPPWGVRALCEHVLDLRGRRVWEPACGGGHMARALAEYASCVEASDIVFRGFGVPFDFLSLDGLSLQTPPFAAVDWIITNPPFRHIGDFIRIGLARTRCGVAVLGRLQLLEGIDRWNTLWKPWHGHITVAPFVERLPMEEGLVAPDTSTATAYAWLVINKQQAGQPPLCHIPPCRAELERHGDYDTLETIQSVRATKANRILQRTAS